jgi:hypothetical protein
MVKLEKYAAAIIFDNLRRIAVSNRVKLHDMFCRHEIAFFSRNYSFIINTLSAILIC